MQQMLHIFFDMYVYWLVGIICVDERDRETVSIKCKVICAQVYHFEGIIPSFHPALASMYFI